MRSGGRVISSLLNRDFEALRQRDARGLTDQEVIEGAQRSTMNELSNVTLDTDRVLVF